MKISAVKIFSLLLFFFLPLLTKAQPLNLIHYNSNNGLAQNSVWNVTQDFYGFIWIGTAAGINVWDGQNFKHYFNNPSDSKSLLGNTGFCFYEINANHMAIGHNQGLSVYCRKTDDFINFKNEAISSIIHFANDTVYCIDKQKRLLGLIFSKKKLIILRHEAIKTESNQVVNGITFYKNHVFFKKSEKHIAYYNIYNYRYNELSFSDSVSDPILINQQLWLFKKDTAIQIIENKEDFQLIKKKAGTVDYNIHSAIYLEDNYWISRLNKLTVLDKNFDINVELNQKLTPYRKEFVYSFYIDRNNNLFLNTNTNGFFIYSALNNRFTNYQSNVPEFNMVKSITKTNNNLLITGSYNGGLSIYDTKNKTTQLISPPNVPHRDIWGVGVFKNNSILGITYTDLFIYDIKKNKTTFKYQFSNTKILQYPAIKEQKNKLIINLNLNLDTKSIIASVDENLNLDTLFTFYETITDYLFLGNIKLIATRNGLYLIQNNVHKKIISGWIKSICSYRNMFYIGTTNGLFILNQNYIPVKYYNSSNKLPDNLIYSAISDNNGNIWFSHNKGLSFLNVSSNKVVNYTLEDGLQANEFNTGAFYKDKNGILYFGGVNGVTEINPLKILKNPIGPLTYITKILINDEEKPLYKNTEDITSISLPFEENTITFNLSSLNYCRPNFQFFKYKLEGLDQDWVTTKNSLIRYSKLPEGKYTFYYSSMGLDGVYGKIQALSVTIKPPFYRTWWFYLLEAFLLISAMSSIIFYIKRRQERKLILELTIQKKLEEDRIRISRDLHDHAGAHLVFLINCIEAIQKKATLYGNDFLNELDKIHQAGKQSINTLRESIWALSNQQITVVNWCDKVKQYVLRNTENYNQINVDFVNELQDEEVELNSMVALQSFRIIQEALNNIIKHADCTSIKILFKTSPKKFIIVITDNGKGFDKSKLTSQGYGLKNIQNRANEIKAELKINSTVGAGTSIELVINT